MNAKKHFITRSLFLITLSLIFLISACGKKQSQLDCPFTSADWKNSIEDITALEGSEYESYKSTYGGTTYTYSKEFMEKSGTIKYMFDQDDELVCVAWAYDGTDRTDDLLNLYNQIHADIVKTKGEGFNATTNDTNYGDIWYLEEGNILIAAMLTESNSALQYAYLSPKVATKIDERVNNK